MDRIRKSLRASFLDGIFASGMAGLITDYITPYAIILKATTSQIGALSSLPHLISSFVQLKSADITERLKSRKRVVNLFVLLHLIMLIPIMLIPYLFKRQAVLFLIIFVTLFTSFNTFAQPAWSSLMSEYIPATARGRYFGWRNKIFVMVTVVSAFISGSILYIFKDDILKGFLIIFVLAFLCRAVSWYFLTKMYDVAVRVKDGIYFSFLDFIRNLKGSNFTRFVFFVAGLNFCVNLAAPYFSVFMLRDLRFSYLIYTILITIVPITQIFTIDRFGRLGDRIGNIKIIRFTSFFIASLPLLWIFSQNILYLIFVQILSGFAWSGFNLCATNFIYDATTPQKRTRCIAYFNTLTGLAICTGALLGGFLAKRLPPLFGYRILTLFLISSTLRFLVASLFSYKIKEVRPVGRVPSRDIFYSFIGTGPIFSIAQETRQILRVEK